MSKIKLKKIESLYKNDKYVVELNNNDFHIKNKKIIITNKLFNNKKGLINFYTPWCIHCQNMVKIWSELAAYFKNKFIIAAVNCEDVYNDNNKLKILMKIKMYPTFKYVSKKGNIMPYKGKHNKDNFMFFIILSGISSDK